jgi:hypothetical protein
VLQHLQQQDGKPQDTANQVLITDIDKMQHVAVKLSLPCCTAHHCCTANLECYCTWRCLAASYCG